MLTCKDSVGLLMDLLDGEMSEDQESALHEHLSACPPCVDFVKTYRSTSSLCQRALLAKQIPAEVSAKLKGFLRAKLKKA